MALSKPRTVGQRPSSVEPPPQKSFGSGPVVDPFAVEENYAHLRVINLGDGT